jgi:3-oxoacyl-[acyl-carrier protein] reductase
MNLKGRVAVVTGGSRGIGRAICLRLASMGALVYVNYVSRSAAAEETVRLISEQGGRGEIVAFDVADGGAVQAAFKGIISSAGSVDILVNNAGITRDGLMARMKEEDWEMMKKKWGRIVNISSVSGFSGNPGQVNYSAAKAGMIGLTKAMAREYASRNITVNAVAPGYIETEMTGQLSSEVQEEIKKGILLASFGKAEDVAGAVAYLVSDDGRYITGQTLHVNGGMYV